MSSVQSAYAQRVTKKFTVTAAAKVFKLASIIAQMPASTQNVGSVYLLPTSAALVTFINGTHGLGDDHHLATVAGDSLEDMGAQVSVGLQGDESKYVTFRKVKVTTGSTIAKVGDGWVGYVVVENNLEQSAANANDLPVAVARV
jgi:hypothetical protein